MELAGSKKRLGRERCSGNGPDFLRCHRGAGYCQRVLREVRNLIVLSSFDRIVFAGANLSIDRNLPDQGAGFTGNHPLIPKRIIGKPHDRKNQKQHDPQAIDALFHINPLQQPC